MQVDLNNILNEKDFEEYIQHNVLNRLEVTSVKYIY